MIFAGEFKCEIEIHYPGGKTPLVILKDLQNIKGEVTAILSRCQHPSYRPKENFPLGIASNGGIGRPPHEIFMWGAARTGGFAPAAHMKFSCGEPLGSGGVPGHPHGISCVGPPGQGGCSGRPHETFMWGAPRKRRRYRPPT